MKQYASELGGFCRKRLLFPEQVVRLRQAAPTWPLASVPESLDANAKPLLWLADQKDLQKRHQDDQREIKRLQHQLRCKDKALSEAAEVLIDSIKFKANWGVDEGD